MIVKLNHAYKEYNTKVIFNDASFDIKTKGIYGIIGRNGCGKSTLLKILTDEVELDSGELTVARNIEIGYLRQDMFVSLEHSVEEEFERIYESLYYLKKQIEQLEQQLDSEEKYLEYASKMERYEQLGGYTYRSEIKTLITKFGFVEEDLQKKLSSFSQGQKTKLALIKLLLQKPDLLLLDEPTNHLDMKTVEWLEGYLKTYPSTILVVSHDRTLLNNICSGIYEVEQGTIHYYPGNYDYYVEAKKVNKAKQHRDYVRQQEEIERLETLIEKFRFKKSKASFVKSKIKYLDRMHRVEDSITEQRVFKPRFISAHRSGNKVLSVEALAIGYDKVLATLDFEIYRNERVALLGRNGVGKSTLLKTLTEEIPALSGDFLFGHHVEWGYFDQDFSSLDNENAIIEEIYNEFPQLTLGEIRSVLATFLFTQEEVFKPLSVLSLGEKVRISLLKLMLLQPNVLLLDEPTNHLDIPSKEALEEALKDYDGTIIFVSHDRYFVSKMANRLLEIEPMKIVDYKVEKSVKEPLKKSNSTSRRSIKKVESQIEKLETKIQELTHLQFEEHIYTDYQKMNEIQQQLEENQHQLELLYEEWELLQR